jgi:hypothetical protein
MAVTGPVIGTTKRIVPWVVPPLGSTGANLEARVDAGIIALNPDIDVRFRVIDLGRHPYVILPAYPGLEVVKRGFRTERTIGTVLEIDVTTLLQDFNGQTVRVGGFDSCFSIQAPEDAVFALRGDSGSLVVDADLSAARGMFIGGDMTRGGVVYACDLDAIFEMLQLETPCTGGLHGIIRRAILRRHFEALTTERSGAGITGEMIHKIDRFRGRYLSDVPDGHMSGALGYLLQALASDLAEQSYSDDDFAGLLDEAFGDWLVQPTIYDMLEYRLPEDFGLRVRKAFDGLHDLCPTAEGFDWMQSALSESGGHTMRELLSREVRIPQLKLRKATKSGR